MNVIILHRIPFAKIRYDLAVDHQRHCVRYLCVANGGTDLPAMAQRRVLDSDQFDINLLMQQHADWLANADCLIARSEYDLLPAAWLRERFGIAGDLTQTVLPLRDKWLMRERCKQAGIAQPAFWSVDAFLAEKPQDGFFLIKPRLEASSTGIRRGNAADIRAALASTRAHENVFVEAFVPGRICHLDGFMRDGEVAMVVCSTYIGTCLNFVSGAPLGSAQTEDDQASIDMLRRTLACLGQRNGSFHFESIVDKDGQHWFLETASRVGGAGVAETFEMRTGINLYQTDLQYQLRGHVTQQPTMSGRDYYGWFVYPAHQGSGEFEIDFDPDRWAGRLLTYRCNARPRVHSGSISYAAHATALSGVVEGSSSQAVQQTLYEIFRQTTVREKV